MTDDKKKIKIGIIGGGAGGMAAAIFASLSDKAEITVFEAKDVPGRKINGTGNGKCNFTNDNMGPEYYRGNDPSFAVRAITVFDNKAAKAFFSKMGIRPKEKNGGYIYPYSEEASSVSSALRLTAESRKVRFLFERVKNVKRSGNGFLINGQSFDRVIMACGSFANMKDITDFNGYDLVKSLGIKLTQLYPALCQIRCSGNFFKTINGVRTDAAVKVLSEGKEIAHEKGEILFTDYGVSGIPAFQLSRYCSSMIAEGKKISLEIDLLPDMDVEEVKTEIDTRLSKLVRNGRNIEESMYGLLNHKLNYVLLKEAGIDPTGNKGAVTDAKAARLIALLKSLKLQVTGTNDFSYSQVVAGGVDTRELNDRTMESLKVPGLYFAGEIIDIDGTCGGYNLQWAWSSGAIAGLSAAGETVPEDFVSFLDGRFR